MHNYDDYTTPPTSLAENRHRRETGIRFMAELVQRYLDRIREEHAGISEGALADYIPELACVDPAFTR